MRFLISDDQLGLTKQSQHFKKHLEVIFAYYLKQKSAASDWNITDDSVLRWRQYWTLVELNNDWGPFLLKEEKVPLADTVIIMQQKQSDDVGHI